MHDLLEKSASWFAVLFLFFGPALVAGALASSLGASSELVPWVALGVFLGGNYLLFLGGVYERIDR